MNATLLENPVQTVCPSRREAELSALVEKLLGEVAQLRGEVAELRQQAGYWKGMFEQTKRKNEKLEKEIDSLRAENRQLKDRLFAAKSEKKPSKDRSNGLDDPKAVNTPRRPRGHQPDAPGPQRRDHSHLPVVDVKLDRNETYEGAAPSKVDGINGWISIQRGCDKFCSFSFFRFACSNIPFQ